MKSNKSVFEIHIRHNNLFTVIFIYNLIIYRYYRAAIIRNKTLSNNEIV